MLSRIYETVPCPSVRPSVSAWAYSSKPAGLLLWSGFAAVGPAARRSIAAAAAGSAPLSAYVGS